MWDGKVDRRTYNDNIKALEELTNNLPNHEVELRQELHKFQLIAEDLPIALWMCNGGGNAIYLNNTWTKWTGQLEKDALGMGWMSALVLEDQKPTFDAWSKVINNKEDYYVYYYRLIHKENGKMRHCGAMANKIGADLWSGVTIDLEKIGYGAYVR